MAGVAVNYKSKRARVSIIKDIKSKMKRQSTLQIQPVSYYIVVSSESADQDHPED